VQTQAVDAVFTAADISSRVERLQDTARTVDCPLPTEHCASRALDLALIKPAPGRHHNNTMRALLIAHFQPSSSDQGVNAASLKSLVTLNLARYAATANDVIAVYITGKIGGHDTVTPTR